VLVDSRVAVENSWKQWASERGVHNDALLQLAHGRRTSESLPEIAPHLDVATEVANLERIESEMTRGLFPVPGAQELLAPLGPGQWAIVTSGSSKVALARMKFCGIPTPSVFVTANDIKTGKPAPEGYLTAAERLGIRPADCIVFEDTRAGIASGKAGGMTVIAVSGTEERDALRQADAVAEKLSDIRLEPISGNQLRVTVAPGVGRKT
jgi:sugar-phosphatase